MKSICGIFFCVLFVSNSPLYAANHTANFSAQESSVWKLPDLSGYRLESLTVANKGTHPIDHILVREAGRDWSSTGAILDTILKEKHPANDKEKALGIFQYVQDYIASSPYRSRYDCYNIWKAFNCYGMGHCEFHTRLLTGLFELAGLASLELNVGLKEPHNFNHTLCEVFYDGSWKLLESWGRVVFLQRDNQNIAGWQDFVSTPFLLKRVRVPAYEPFGLLDPSELVNEANRAIFFLTHKKSRGFRGDGSRHSLTLRPGESFAFFWDGEGVFVNNFRPPEYIPNHPTSKGILATRFPSPQVGWTSLSHSHGFNLEKDGTLSVQEGNIGSLEVNIEVPYPIVQGGLSLAFEVLDNASLVSLSAEKKAYPKVSPKVLSTWKSAGKYREKVVLTPTISEWNTPFVSYSYSLSLTASGKVMLASLEVETVCEVARISLPQPSYSPWIVSSSGQANDMLNAQLITTELPPKAEPPQINEEILNISGDKPLTLSWSEPALIQSKVIQPNQVQYDLVLSDDPEFRWQLLPLMYLRKDLSQTQFSIPRDYLPFEGQHFYKVRTLIEGYEPSPWSATGKIVYSKTDIPPTAK